MPFVIGLWKPWHFDCQACRWKLWLAEIGEAATNRHTVTTFMGGWAMSAW